MNKQAHLARRLFDLHHSGELLLLPNIWNPIGARMLQAKGFPAVATASAAISAMLGYQDGEQIWRETLLDILRRIVASVDVPVSADYEAGYADTLDDLAESIGQLLDTGVVGLNIEDSLGDEGKLRPLNEQVERIQVVREVAEKRGIHLVINARPDSFFAGFATREDALEDAVTRATAYIAAGADCIYPIGASDPAIIRQLHQRIAAPINILGSSAAPPLATLREIGVQRVSLGPFVFRSVLQRFEEVVDQVQGADAYPANVMSGGDVAAYLRQDSE